MSGESCETASNRLPLINKLTFTEFCSILNQIRNPIRSNQPKRKVQVEIVRSKLVDRLAPNENPLPLLRLMLPQLDRERGPSNIGITSLARLYIDIFSLPPPAIKQLKAYKNPNILQDTDAIPGDFSSSVFVVLRGRLDVHAELMVTDINEWLTDLYNASGDFASKRDVFSRVIVKATPVEIFWITRIILKDMRLGLPHTLILSAFYPQAGSLAGTLFGLEDILRACGTPSDTSDASRMEAPTRINNSAENMDRITLFRPFKPMLVNRLKRQDIPKVLFSTSLPGNALYLVEPKLDGERLICHLSKSRTTSRRVELYTRRGTNYSGYYGDALHSILLDHIRGTEVILDGEVVARSITEQTFLPFGTNRAAAQGLRSDVCLCYTVFDILWYSNGTDTLNLMNYSLTERREFLIRVVETVPDRLLLMPSRHATCPEDIEEELERIIEERGEGVVVKDASSRYLLNDRSSGWYKVKPVFGVFGDTLDLLVIGGYFGRGTRLRQQESLDVCDHVTTFLCAILENPDTRNEEIRAISFCRIGSGYNTAELGAMRDALREHLVLFDSPVAVPYLLAERETFSRANRPDVVVDALHHGFIIEVRAAELIPAPSFGTKVTLRFPRTVKPYRDDKAWNEAMTLADLQAYMAEFPPVAPSRPLTAAQDVSISMSPRAMLSPADVKSDIDDVTESPRRAKRPHLVRSPVVHIDMEGSKEEEVSSPGETSDVPQFFASYRFLVLHVAREKRSVFRNKWNKQVTDTVRLRRSIQRHGGILVDRLQAYDNVYVVAQRCDFRTLSLHTKFQCPIVTHQYIQRCVAATQLLPLRPLDVLHATKEMSDRFSQFYDLYGDPYEEDLTSKDVKELVTRMDDNDTLKDPFPPKEELTDAYDVVRLALRSTRVAPLQDIVFFLHEYRYLGRSTSYDWLLWTPLSVEDSVKRMRRAVWYRGVMVKSLGTIPHSLEVILHHKATVLGASFTQTCIEATHAVDPCYNETTYGLSQSGLAPPLTRKTDVVLVPPFPNCKAECTKEDSDAIQFRIVGLSELSGESWLPRTTYKHELETIYRKHHQNARQLAWVSTDWLLKI